MRGIGYIGSRAKRRGVGVCMLTFLSASVLLGSGGLTAFAQSSPATSNTPQITDGTQENQVSSGGDESIEAHITTVENAVQTIYLIMWPSLAIAGASLDNSLVYGQAFFLDKSLWRFWQLMRTFANYVLGFIFVGSILLAFFKSSSDDKWVGTLFKRLLIAGLLVNMSRWMVASLIDFSTIATAALGSLPLHVMSETKEWKDIRLLKSHSLMDYSNMDDVILTKMDRSTIYSCAFNSTPEFFIPCPINDNLLFDKNGDEREPLTLASEKQKYADAWANKEVMIGKELQTVKVDKDKNISSDYCAYGNTLLKYNDKKPVTQQKSMQDMKKEGTKYMIQQKCATMTDLIESAAGSTGPLYALYGSILHMATLSQTSNFGNASEIIVEVIMKIIVGLALVIPLLVLAVVLVIRAVVLWLVIAFSPLLVMAYTFEFKKINEGLGGKMKLGSIIGLIFLPVFAVFAVSISVIFLTVLGNIDMIEARNKPAPTAPNQPDGAKNDPLTIIGGGDIMRITGDNPEDVCYEFMSITTICVSEATRKTGADIVNVMVWTVLNFFGIALMWTVIFLVLKSNAITGEIAGKLEGLAKDAMSSIRFIPTGKGEFTSLGAVGRLPQSARTKLADIQQKQFSNSFGGLFNENPGANKAAEKRMTEMQASPEKILTTESVKGTGPAAYDGAAENVVQYINSKTSNPDHKISSSVKTMEGLAGNKDFARRGLSQGDDYQNFLKNMDKSGNAGTRATFGASFVNGLMELSKEEQDGKRMGDNERVNPDGTHPVDYIWTSGQLMRIPYERPDTGSDTLLVKYDAVKQYALPNGNIENKAQLAQFMKLKADAGGDIASLGKESKILKKYRDREDGQGLKNKIAAALTDEQKKGKGKTVEVKIPLGGNTFTVHAKVNEGKVIDIVGEQPTKTPPKKK